MGLRNRTSRPGVYTYVRRCGGLISDDGDLYACHDNKLSK